MTGSRDPKAADQASVLSIDELLEGHDLPWSAVRTTLGTDPRSLDRLLLKLHYRRNRVFTGDVRNRILQYLWAGYEETADIRYLNEYLWFDVNEDHPDRQRCLEHFRRNLTDGVHHSFPLATPSEVNEFIQSASDHGSPIRTTKTRLKVGLLGAPHGFVQLEAALQADGMATEIVFFTQGERSRWRRFAKSSWIVPQLAYWKAGGSSRYRTIRTPPDHQQSASNLSSRGFDVAVHRLGFIIRQNMIDAFSIGIINDHLGILPFVRGRSTLEYSLLFGFPVGSTVHLVDAGVDTGDLLRHYTYEIGSHRMRTVAEVKRRILASSDERFAEVVRDIANGHARRMLNPGALGLQFFTMHPFLIGYIEREILPTLRT